ncbi:MAG: DNA repair protein [Gammaproteobacteria bacterium]|nr:MAG: DNA repair protein [Gammaproteobacteria bacterium]
MKEQLLIASEISIKYEPKVQPINRPRIKTSEDAYLQCLFFFGIDNLIIKEEAVVLFLNRGNRVLGGYKASSGGIDGTVVDNRLILGIALKCLASGLIVAHNHPSGELNPSRADKDLTQKLKEAAKLMDISLLDHLIITSETYFSFANEGLI